MSNPANFIVTVGSKLPICEVKEVVINLLINAAANTPTPIDDLAVGILNDTLDFLLPQCKDVKK